MRKQDKNKLVVFLLYNLLFPAHTVTDVEIQCTQYLIGLFPQLPPHSLVTSKFYYTWMESSSPNVDPWQTFVIYTYHQTHLQLPGYSDLSSQKSFAPSNHHLLSWPTHRASYTHNFFIILYYFYIIYYSFFTHSHYVFTLYHIKNKEKK